MRAFPVFLVVMLACIVSASSTVASGTLEAGLLRVDLENGHRGDCVENVSGLCPASMSGTGPHDTLNVTQDLRQAAIFLDVRSVNEATGVMLLPDGSLRIDAADVATEHQTFIILTERVGSVSIPLGAATPVAYVNESGISASSDLNGVSERRGLWFTYNERGGIGYRHLGPFHVIGHTTTDHWTEDFTSGPCRVNDDSACFTQMATIADRVESAAPEVLFGASLGTTIVTTDPSHFAQAAGGMRSMTSADIPRGGGSSPDPSLSIRPTTNPGFDVTAPRPIAPIEERILDPRSGPRASPPTSPVHEPPDPKHLSPLLPLAASFVLAILAALLYSRLGRREQALAHPTRVRILALVSHAPRTLTDLSRELGVDPTTALYHARLLEKTEHVVLRGQGRFTYVCPPGQAAPKAPPSAAERVGEELLRILTEAGGALPRAELHARASRFPAWARNEAIRALARAGRIARGFANETEMLRVAGA